MRYDNTISPTIFPPTLETIPTFAFFTLTLFLCGMLEPYHLQVHSSARLFGYEISLVICCSWLFPLHWVVFGHAHMFGSTASDIASLELQILQQWSLHQATHVLPPPNQPGARLGHASSSCRPASPYVYANAGRRLSTRTPTSRSSAGPRCRWNRQMSQMRASLVATGFPNFRLACAS